MMHGNEDKLKEALSYIDPDALMYQEWVNVGMALKSEGLPFSLWDEWSSQGAKYNAREMKGKWDSFNEEGMSVVSGGTIIYLAQQCGMPIAEKNEGKALDYDDWVEDYTPITSVETVKVEKVPQVTAWSPFSEIRRYLDLLFEDEEYVSINTQYYTTEKGKKVPTQGASLKKSDIIDEMEKQKGKDISYVIGDYDKDVGAWVRFNPLDGDGVKDSNVTDYRYALVECDGLTIDQQYSLIKELQLPVRVLVHSGNKSLHAIVKIHAYDYSDYRRKVQFLYKTCIDNGLKVDTADKNPSRLSRLPGIERGSQKQYIIDSDIGCESYEEWEEFIKNESSKIPKIQSLSDVWDDMPPLKPEIIEGILRKGHKLMVSSDSKAGKTWAMIELCAAIANGGYWLGKYKCAKGKALYINFEVDGASCFHRFKNVINALGSGYSHDGIDVWNLRGHASTIEKMVPTIVKQCKDKQYSMIVLDPIYKVQDGDENSAGDIGKFCNQLDKIATELDASIVFVHHHAKGAQGGKSAQDRASGSGVFARDPDALIDFVQVDTSDYDIDLEKNETVWRIESTLREFAPISQGEFVFSYPIHRPVEGLEDAPIYDAAKVERRKHQEKREADRTSENEKRKDKVLELVSFLDHGDGVAGKELSTIIANELGMVPRTAQRMIDDIVTQGLITKKIIITDRGKEARIYKN